MATVDSSELLALLRREGWTIVRIKGSHHHLKHLTKPGLVTVPHPKKDLPIGTVRSILRVAGIDPKDIGKKRK